MVTFSNCRGLLCFSWPEEVAYFLKKRAENRDSQFNGLVCNYHNFDGNEWEDALTMMCLKRNCNCNAISSLSQKYTLNTLFHLQYLHTSLIDEDDSHDFKFETKNWKDSSAVSIATTPFLTYIVSIPNDTTKSTFDSKVTSFCFSIIGRLHLNETIGWYYCWYHETKLADGRKRIRPWT